MISFEVIKSLSSNVKELQGRTGIHACNAWKMQQWRMQAKQRENIKKKFNLICDR